MHQLGRADDGVHGACLDAFCAADALVLADVGNLGGRRATAGIKGNDGQLKQLRQGRYGLFSARRAFVDRLAIGNAGRIGFASRVPAFAALGLR
ncbi:hypothetical protein D9M72_645510 [compost metagenome]